MHGRYKGLYGKLKFKKMEFLLQMFANMIGDPDEDQTDLREKITKNDADSRAAHAIEEEPVLFSLMQFH